MEKQTQNSSRSKVERVTRLAFLVALSALTLAACQSASVQGEPSPTADEVPNGADPTQVTEAPVKPSEIKGDPLVFDASLSTQKAKDGSLVELRLKPTEPIDVGSVRVSLEGQEFPVFEAEGNETLISLIVVPFNSKPRDTKIDLTWNMKGASVRRASAIPLTVVDGNYRSEVLTVQEEKVNPPKRVVKRIMAEQKEIGALYRSISTKRYWSGPFLLPIESEVTSPFGNKRVYNGSMKSFHQGLDLRARTPVPIRAPEGARVAMAKDLYFTGNTVILDHGYGLFTIYGHMSKMNVKKDDVVTKGQVLGLSGMTGRASGPHLHWGAVLMRQKFNPQDLVQALR